MTKEIPRQILLHPQFGELPARRVLECVFALRPDGPILHCHIDELTVTETARDTRYAFSGQPPDPARARCRIIPPRVLEFPKL